MVAQKITVKARPRKSLVFCLLYTPCVAAIASIRRELGNRDAVTVVIFQCLIAYVMALFVYQIVSL